MQIYPNAGALSWSLAESYDWAVDVTKSQGSSTNDVLNLGYSAISCFVQFRIYGTLIATVSNGTFMIANLHTGTSYQETASAGYVLVAGSTSISYTNTAGVYIDMHTYPFLYGHTYNPGISYRAGTSSGSKLTGTIRVEIYKTERVVSSVF